MIEAIVGALVLALTSLAIMDGLDGAQKRGRLNKERSVSATLAQQDIERLRAFPVTSLSNYRETRAVNVAGVPYTVTSRTDWVRDSSGIISCTNDATAPQYLKLTSSVNAKATDSRSVREVSLLTPAPGAFSATSGTLAVKVTDRDGNVHQNVGVTLTGATSSYSDMTNDEGCAIFGMVPAGNYQVDVPGLVGWGGEGFPGAEAAVVAAKTSLAQVEVDRAASLRADFELPTGLPTSPTAWTTLALSSSITVANAKVPGGYLEFTSGVPAPSINGTGLFPFLDGYGVYAGTCRANNPAFWQGTYFQTSGKGFVQLAPGEWLKPVPVQMGVLRVLVRTSASGTPLVTWPARVTVRRGDSGDTRAGCAVDTLAATVNPITGIADFVLPMGTYRLCGSAPVSTSTGTVRRRVTGGAGNPAHPRLAPTTGLVQTVTLQIPSSGSSGACP